MAGGNAKSKKPEPRAAATPARVSQTRVVVRSIPGAPSEGAPQPPSGWAPIDRQEAKGIHAPAESQRALVPALIAELEASKSYAKDFPKAPAASEIVSLLSVASAWEAEAEAAASWASYAHSTALRAWGSLEEPVAKLAKQLDRAVEDEPSVAKKYPTLTAYHDAPKEIAKRGAATRKANAKRKQAAAK